MNGPEDYSKRAADFQWPKFSSDKFGGGVEYFFISVTWFIPSLVYTRTLLYVETFPEPSIWYIGLISHVDKYLVVYYIIPTNYYLSLIYMPVLPSPSGGLLYPLVVFRMLVKITYYCWTWSLIQHHHGSLYGSISYYHLLPQPLLSPFLNILSRINFPQNISCFLPIDEFQDILW